MYNHEHQYRCTIVRGKSISLMDDILPTYAKIIDDICPCLESEFKDKFDNELRSILSNPTQKTLDNHRTENASTLFGMYFLDDDGIIYATERTKKFLEDNDQPAFFKDMCFKLQFPSGMDSIKTIRDRLDNDISLRPVPFIIKVLLILKDHNITLNKKEIGYYILNSLDVLQGIATPKEVIARVLSDRSSGVERVITIPGKASSYTMQHINEQLVYMELANLIIITDGEVHPNTRDIQTLEYFASFHNEPPIFDAYSYDFNDIEQRKLLRSDWNKYYGLLSDNIGKFDTTISSLGITEEEVPPTTTTGRKDLMAIGDEGEMIVYEFEKNRVKAFNTRLANKVIHLGKTRGLGYDIQSVIAQPGGMAEFVKYIEVKSTKRVTEPRLEDSEWQDTINMTRNEWIAAQQHGDFYSIYRVYLVRGKVIMYIIKNVSQKEKDGKIGVVPLTYRVDFKASAVDEVIA